MNTFYKRILPFAFVITILLPACEFNHPTAVPAYIHIDKFNLTTDYNTQGSNSHKITDVWVFVDDKLLGDFELPATFPVIADGMHHVKIKPGIKVSGISSDRAPYPFFETYEQYIDFKPGQTVTLSPTTTYLSSTTFAFMQDFESVGTSLEKTSMSDTSLQEIISPNPDVFEGSKSGAAYVDGYRFFECSTINALPLPKGGAPVFLEFNYKCNYEFTVSVYAYGYASAIQYASVRVVPSSNWNKMYVYLTPNVSGASNATEYKITWGMLNNGSSDAILLLDNIKLVY